MKALFSHGLHSLHFMSLRSDYDKVSLYLDTNPASNCRSRCKSEHFQLVQYVTRYQICLLQDGHISYTC
jgi:hypothetical protein